MLSSLAKMSLVGTSLAPVFLTLWFVDFSKKWQIRDGLPFLIIALVLFLICWFLLNVSKKKLEKLPIIVTSVKTADSEIIGFIILYLLPLISDSAFKINISVLIFVAVLFFAAVYTSNSYHFNPLVGFLGYHFYEITIDGGVTYVLITKKNISHSKGITSVVQISEYMVLEI